MSSNVNFDESSDDPSAPAVYNEITDDPSEPAVYIEISPSPINDNIVTAPSTSLNSFDLEDSSILPQPENRCERFQL